GYKVRWWHNGKRKEAYRKSYEDALALQCDLKERLFFGSCESFRKTHLSDGELKDAEAAALALGGRLSLLEAAQIALNHKPPNSQTIRLETAVEGYFKHLEEACLRAETVKKYKQTANRLLLFCGGSYSTASLSSEKVKAFMSQFTHPLNFNARRRELSRFLGYLRRHQQMHNDPLKDLPNKRIDAKEPKVLNPEQVAQLLSVAASTLPRKALPALALQLFAAVRPQEMRRLSLSGEASNLINLETGYFTLPASIAKGRALRKIQIRPALRAYLEAHGCVPELSDYQIKKLKNSISFHIPPDGLRHTAITGIFHDLRNFAETALETGNSEIIIRKHYLGNWTPMQAKEFWSLRPIPP
ncbi:MAG: tyrosine-type recombinase/integrase, partial [Coraliomargaritaceae bacterium]